MTITRPSYYDKFRCLAGYCRHNCCIGWEIDIDEETMEKYEGVTGEFAQRLHENISLENTPHFILREDDRCPFLNEKNLCDIIINLGEEYLCEICREHPRFYNVYSSFAEAGLGLSCEEAARIIITSEEPFLLISDEDIEYEALTQAEKDLLSVRNDIFKAIDDPSKSLDEKIKELLSGFNISSEEISSHNWAEEFSRLEILDRNWEKHISCLASYEKSSSFPFEAYENAFKNLLIYFIYRHLHECIYDGCLNERLAFAVISVMVIYRISAVLYEKNSSFGIKDIIELSRMYSSEVEYSEENTQYLIDILFEIV